MIETEQQTTIAVPIGAVWDHVRDIRRWAALMPGLQDCEIIDDDSSRWVLKVGVGGLVRTVTVDVHVDEWSGPGAVRFTYSLQGDPVQGGGTYRAEPEGDGATRVTLAVEVIGSGPLAPMWEAMGRPLLPQLARGFTDQLKAAIEAGYDGLAAEAPLPPQRGFLAWLRRVFGFRSGRDNV